MDPIFVAKLALTPTLIGGISLVARRFGPRAGGTLAGLPWTSATISVFLALERGPNFAQSAAVSTAAAVPAVVAFCLAYAALARLGWPLAVAGGIAAFMIVVALAVRSTLDVVFAFLVSLAVVAALIAFPRVRPTTPRPPPPGWDIPARMATATLLVLTLTAFAGVLGPAWTGALSPFPVFASVLAAFTHMHDGPEAAIDLLRGVMVGLLSFSAFFLVVGLMLPHVPLGPTYASAAAAAVATNAAAWAAWLMFRGRARTDGQTPPAVGE